MKNAAAVALRADYKALTIVVDGLMDIIFNRQACNILTMARMAEEAKSAARRLASELERIIFTETPTVAEKVAALSLFARLQLVILLLLAGLALLVCQKVKNREQHFCHSPSISAGYVSSCIAFIAFKSIDILYSSVDKRLL